MKWWREEKRIMKEGEKFSSVEILIKYVSSQLLCLLIYQVLSYHYKIKQRSLIPSPPSLNITSWTLVLVISYQIFPYKVVKITVWFAYTVPTLILAIEMRLSGLYTVEVLCCIYLLHVLSSFYMGIRKIKCISRVLAEHRWLCRWKLSSVGQNITLSTWLIEIKSNVLPISIQ